MIDACLRKYAKTRLEQDKIEMRRIRKLVNTSVKDRHQWWGREFRCSLSLNMDKLFPKAIINVLYH